MVKIGIIGGSGLEEQNRIGDIAGNSGFDQPLLQTECLTIFDDTEIICLTQCRRGYA